MLRNVLIVKLQNCTLLLHVFTFQLCTCSGMCLLLNWQKLYTVNSMYFLSALYMLRYVPIVKMTLVIFYSKKKKKKKMTRTLVWVKNAKVMPLKSRYLSFLLGKGGNPYVCKLYIKNSVKVRFLPCPPACKSF